MQEEVSRRHHCKVLDSDSAEEARSQMQQCSNIYRGPCWKSFCDVSSRVISGMVSGLTIRICEFQRLWMTGFESLDVVASTSVLSRQAFNNPATQKHFGSGRSAFKGT